MKYLCIGTVAMLSAKTVMVADQVQLDLQAANGKGAVVIHGQFSLPVSSMYPAYTVQSSTDHQGWANVAGPFSGGTGVSDEVLSIVLPMADEYAFYRVLAEVKLDSAEGGGGEAVFGYSTEFNRQLQKLGQIPLADFVQQYSHPNTYLPHIGFDVTEATFWDQFNLDPAVFNATNSYYNSRTSDFRLTPAEFAVFQTSGFVVSQRMERESFADVYYDIYTDDLPVFVSADSILHAWHRSFETMLEEIEETRLHAELLEILEGMAAQVPNLWAQAAGSAMTNGVLDADYFLAVARSLLLNANRYGSLGQTSRVQQTLTAIEMEQPGTNDLYGEPRLVDFSQFTVRGHYANSALLERYFRAMMWCALADFRYAGFSTGVSSGETNNTIRELTGTVALGFLARDSGQLDNWLQFNRVLELYVGTTDSLNLAQLNDLLAQAGIASPADLPNQAALTNLQTLLMSGELGMQQVTSGYYWSPLGPEQVKLPRSFTFMGQRFVMDSWALGKCTFDDIVWHEEGIRAIHGKVLRRVPSALDVAFCVFGNGHVVPELAARISDTNGHPWRDGMPYQHNLSAVRNTIDTLAPDAWTNSIYTRWLSCLRELSRPTTAPEFPQAMRTRAWAMKTLNTQLASWTQLRHDTVLYAVQSYTPILLCEYPDGYVEPRRELWQRIQEMALATREVLATLPTNGVFTYDHVDQSGNPFVVEVTGSTMHANRLAVMDAFVDATTILDSISEKELGQLPLSSEETEFLRHIVEVDYVGERTYGGWYPSLFYIPASQIIPWGWEDDLRDTGDGKGSDYWDALVTDVHTDPTDHVVGDPGSILHEAVGNVQLLMIAVDSGPDLAVYAGPVLSHYEFELGPDKRLTDAEWRTHVSDKRAPRQPSWTRSYLVPRSKGARGLPRPR